MSGLPTQSRGLRFSLAEVMVLVVLTAMVCKWPVLFVLAVPALADRITGKLGVSFESRDLASLGPVLGSVYLPCVFGFFGDGSHCRLVWVKLFPIVPGLFPAIWMTYASGFRWLPESIQYGIGAMVTLEVVGMRAFIGRRGWPWLIACLIIGFCYSSWVARVMYALIRA